MKVGMIFECGPQGADRKVCELLARRFKVDLEIESITLGNKRILITDCGKAAAQLIRAGCERIIIIWDLCPPWRETRPNCKQDCEEIRRSLVAAGVNLSYVALVCIREELEAWLVADKRAIEIVLSRPTNPVRINEIRRPEEIKNPKKKLMQIYHQNSGRPYNDLIDAERIVQALPDFNRIKRCITFARFARKVANVILK